MTLSEIVRIYARLTGFVAGSFVERAASLLPERLSGCLSHAAVQAASLAPEPVSDGLTLALGHASRGEPPVLIVPGFAGPSILLWPLAAFLRLHGRKVEQLNTFPALDGVAAMAARIAASVDRLLAESGQPQIDLVVHSMGGLAGRYYMLRLGGAERVRRFVTIATPHHGTRLAWVPFFGQSVRDLRPDSPVIRELADAPLPKHIKTLTIRAGWDQIVWPREHARWGEHAEDVELPFAEHWAVQLDPRTLALVIAALESPAPAMPEGVVPLDAANRVVHDVSQELEHELGAAG